MEAWGEAEKGRDARFRDDDPLKLPDDPGDPVWLRVIVGSAIAMLPEQHQALAFYLYVDDLALCRYRATDWMRRRMKEEILFAVHEVMPHLPQSAHERRLSGLWREWLGRPFWEMYADHAAVRQ